MASLFKHSHIPSQPKIRNSSFSDITCSVTSGKDMINYSVGFIEKSFLYSKSPIALDKFKFPLTLPSNIIPPALIILSLSGWSSGLWSLDNGIAYLLLHKTHLESPAFATNIDPLWIKATFPVHPAVDSFSSNLFSLQSFFNFHQFCSSFFRK